MATVTLEGAQLTVSTSGIRKSTQTVLLDSLRLAYLFLPQQVQWRLIAPSETRFRYVNLEALSEEPFAEFAAMLKGQPPSGTSRCLFLLAGYEGQSVTVSLKDCLDGGVDLLGKLQSHKASRAETRQVWLRGRPNVALSGVSFDMRGVQKGKRDIPWNALDYLEIRETSTVGTTIYVHFVPIKGSGHKRFFQGMRPAQIEAFLAEIDYWRKMGSSPAALAEARERQAQADANPARWGKWVLIAMAAAVLLIVILVLVSGLVNQATGANRGPVSELCALVC